MVNLRDIYQDPNFSDQQVYGPPAPAGQTQPRSLLDMLRERSARELEGENLTRMRDFGAGMLASGSPNFFTNLAAGTRAQAEGERSRTDRLRQLAETERQARAQQAEEQYRRDQLEIERQRRDYERDPRNPRNILYGEQADFYRQGGRGAGAGGPRGQITPERYAQIVSQADAEARQRFPNPAAGMPESAAQAAERERRRNEFRDNRVRQILEGAAQIQSGGTPTPGAPDVTAAPTPAARIDARGNPIR